MTRVNTYVTAITAVAIAAAGLVYVTAPGFDRLQVEAVIWLSVLGVVTLLQVHRLPKGGSGSATFIAYLASVLLSPTWLTVAGVTAACVIGEAASKRALVKAVFNAAQTALAVSLGIVTYRVLGGTSMFVLRDLSLLESSSRIAVPLAALVSCYFLINSLAACSAIALSSNGQVLRVWKQTVRGTWLYDVLSGPVVFICAWTYMELGPLGTLGLIIPVLGARQLYRTNRQLEQVNEDLLQLMVKAIEARDPYTSGHSRRVSHYSKIIARAIGLGAQHVERIGVAALLHDVGKIHEIYAPILRKPGKLTPDEWAIMQTHPVKSAELVGTVSNLKDVIGPIRSHHENWDGSGYPDGLAREGIPLGARIIKFADTIDAMTSDRPYRRAMGEDEVRAELKKFAGIQFDPEITQRLLASPSFKLLFAAERRDSGPTLVPARLAPRDREKATA